MTEPHDLTDSIERARREHAHATRRRDDDSIRLLQRAIDATRDLAQEADGATDALQQTLVSALQDRYPELPTGHIAHIVRESIVAVAVATQALPSTQQVINAAVTRLNREQH